MDDDTAFDLYKGGLKYLQGTRYSLDAFMKNKALFGADATANYLKSGLYAQQTTVMYVAEIL